MKSSRRVVALLLILGCNGIAVARERNSAAQKAAPGGVTLQKVMSAPFPSELVAAPVKGRFAWMFYAEGKRNIWYHSSSAEMSR